MTPLVSICIPTFNGESYLVACLDSILSQSYKNIEIVISDDRSSDGTIGIIESFKRKCNFPLYLHNHEPSGIGANWNNSVEKSHGQYVKFLFQDDLLLPNCISDMLDVIQLDENIGLVTCNRDIICEFDLNANEYAKSWLTAYSDLLEYWKVPTSGHLVIDKTEFKKDDFFYKHPINKIGEPTCVLFKREVFDRIGGFSNVLQQRLDIQYWYRVLKYYKIGLVNKKLVAFRLHNEQATSKNHELSEKLDSYVNKNFFFLLNKDRQMEILRNQLKKIRFRK